jgi:hypothetical protein
LGLSSPNQRTPVASLRYRMQSRGHAVSQASYNGRFLWRCKAACHWRANQSLLAFSQFVESRILRRRSVSLQVKDSHLSLHRGARN